MITGATSVFGLLGRPIRHSLSPVIHNPWLQEHQVDGVYVALEVPEGRVPDAADAMRTLGLAGLNLTVPFKATVLDGCDRLSSTADAARAVNVLVPEGGRIVGHNTDAEGFARSLEAVAGDLAGRRAVVLGAGGAGRAVAAGLCARGLDRVVLANRTVARAEAAAARLAAAYPGVAVSGAPLDRDALSGADVVVVATSGPAAGAVAGLDPAVLPDHAVWCDLNYWMEDPPGLSAAAGRGLAVLDGLPMLVHQAALAFELWTGILPDARSTLRRLRTALPIPQGS